MAGGGSVDSEQVLTLTREIAGIGAKQDIMMESIKELKDMMPTKAELKSVEQRVTRLEEDKKHKTATVISSVAAVAAVASVIVAIWAVLRK